VSIIESPMGQSLSNIEEDYVIKLIPTENRDEFKISLKREEENIRQGQGTERRYTTSQNGSFEIMLKPKREYLFVAKKNAYRMGEKVFSTRNINLEQDLEICIPLEKANCLNMEGVVLNKKYGNRIPNATVELLNQCTGEQSKLVTDEEGQFFFPCLACGCDFIISGHKAYFTRDTKRENTLNGKCEKGEVLKVSLELMPSLEPELTLNYIPNSPPGTNPYPNEAPNSNPANHSNSGYPFVNGLPTYNQIPITTGAIIELDNIYYDFDQSYIRSGAARELDRVADLMRRFPSLLIELNSHTDARGTNQYNEALSQKRAEEAVRYIASQGIDRRRLVAKGYGEQQLRNQCANQVDCSEEAHQYNRRTEIKVLYFDRRDVGVIYKDSGPEKIDRANPKRQFIWD
ncbi:MAG: OmpA family protein, partial [Bacteroidota bacterium]